MNWLAECRKWHKKGVEQRAEMAYDSQGIPLRIFIHSEENPEGVLLESQDGFSPEFAKRLQLLNAVMRVVKPAAVLIQTDGWFGRMDKVAERCGLPISASADVMYKAFNKLVNEEYDGTMANMPEELRAEGILTVIKGPKFPQISIITFYHGDGDKVVLEEEMEESKGLGILNVIPDWWKPIVN